MLWEWIKEVLGFEGGQQVGRNGRFEVYAIRLRVHYREGSPALTDDGTFYIGSGVYPTRKEQHIKEARRKLLTEGGRMKLSHKEKTLLWAEDNAVDVDYVTLWRTDNREEAFCVEKNLINKYGIERLTNRVYGHCNQQGLQNSQLKKEYCRTCGVQLDIGRNIPARRFANRDYICTPCSSKQTIAWKKTNQIDRTAENRKRAAKKKARGECRQGCGRKIGLLSTVYCDICAQNNRDNANRYYAKKKAS